MRVPNNKFIVPAGALALVALAVIVLLSLDRGQARPTTDIVTLTADVRAGNVSKVIERPSGRAAIVHYEDSSKDPHSVSVPSGTSLTELFTTAGIPISAWPDMQVSGESALTTASPVLRIVIVIAIIVAILFFIRKTQSGFGRQSSRKGAFDPIKPGERPVLMTDVAGAEEVKEEISDIIEYLRDPERFQKLGAKIPRGALLVGPPGTGKTLIARAVAGEARAAFFSVSGSEFVELYVGVGASRVRELFKRARECAPAIIFVDEIDAIGRQRGRADHSTEYDQTLNQILVEMDGFEASATVVVLAATNRADILDSALTRPGRFDRKVFVDLPDRAARAAILAVHARGKPISDKANFDTIAARTTGMSGAELANLVNEAAILSARRGSTEIEMDTLLEAIDRTLAGAARKSGRFSERERQVIAYHEAGHALVAHYLPHGDPVLKVSIVSRGRAGGYTMIVPAEDRGLWTRAQLTDRLAGLLGGYAAEEITFGDITTGSSNDLERASTTTLAMVSRYGMGKAFGLLSIGEGNASAASFSQRTTFAAESEARFLVETARDLARSVIEMRRDKLELLARRLLEVESLDGDEIDELLGPPVTAEGMAVPSGTRVRALPSPAPAAPRRSGRPSRSRRITAIPAAAMAAIKSSWRQPVS
ncbi:MAG TPA: ATP-dependent zinc metalloprotease FtsH [Thermomicrobiales bacterium]|nr:ATP-dependent zinc metalloprotease FtsH [Thermomicrobiales bacterium]